MQNVTNLPHRAPPCAHKHLRCLCALGGCGASRVATFCMVMTPARRRLTPTQHRDPQPVIAGRRHREVIAGVDVTNDSHAGVGLQGPLEALGGQSVPSATHTWPAWIDLPMPTPPPWWIETQLAPQAVLISALSNGQSATASEPSRHRLGLALGRGDRAGVEVVAPDHDRGLDLAGGDHLVEAQPGEMALAVAEPADPRRQALEVHPLGRQLDPAARCAPGRRTGRGSRDRWRGCRPDRPTAPPSGTGPCPRRTAAARTPARTPGS